jgi:hypothetical protein
MKIDFTPRLQMTGAIAGIAIGVGGLVLGEVHKSEANKKAKALQNSRPTLTPSPYTKDELSLTQSELAGGMGADAERGYTEQLDKDTSGSLDALIKGGGSVNNVADIFSGKQEGRQRLTMMKENLRLNNIHNFISASRNAEEGRQQEFQFNQFAPWADASQANAQEKQGAEQQINTGVNTAASGVAGELSNISQKNSLNDYFKTGSGGSSTGRYETPDYSTLDSHSSTPDVAGSAGNPPNEAQQLNYNFNNSSNTSPWDTPGGS